MKKFFLLITCLMQLFPLSLRAAAPQAARRNAPATLHGSVKGPDGKPLDFATVFIQPSGLHTLTDADGRFRLDQVPAGESVLSISFYGMQQIDTMVVVKAGSTLAFSFEMQETSFRLKNVVVTARRNDAGHSTASEISRQAMDHLQTGSLGDVLALLPGVAVSNPNLNTSQSLSVRNTADTYMGSLGTSVLVDGAPVSNNANLQFLSSSIGGSTYNSLTKGNAVAGADVRSLSTDNVESVEVIRGIPSAEYGDLTSGAVLVRSKAGRSPLTLRFKTNPNLYQASLGKGFGLGRKAGELNVSGDYAYSRNKLISDFRFYQRANLKGLWSVRLDGEGRATENTSLTLSFARDREKYSTNNYSQSWDNTLGVAFNTNGRYSAAGNWLKSVNWLVSGSFNNREYYVEDRATNAMNLYSTCMENGVYSNIIGQHVFDAISGTEITTLMDASGRVLPYNYDYSYSIFGKELNVFAKVNAELSHTWGALTDRLLAGADFKTDGNLGRGAVYDDEFPPFRNVSNASSGYRRRPYYDIPFVNQLGVYLEDYLYWKVGARVFTLSAGARYDLINGKGVLAPRINASIDLLPGVSVRGGWGIAAKAPTSLYLNPMPAYHDAINFNGMIAGMPESEQLLVATTRIYDASNPELEIATNRKAELGMDLKILKRYRLSLTAYDERMDNGYTIGLGVPSFVWYQHQTYKESVHNAGAIPDIVPDAVYNLFFNVYRPYNNVKAVNRGLEYELDLGRFDAIRTSFYLNGAWNYGSTTNRSYSFSTRTKAGEPEANIGVYNPEKTTDHFENLLTTLRVTHNIPQIGFVVTATAQVDWFQKDWSTFNNDDALVGYISRTDGQLHLFDAAMTYEQALASPLSAEISYLYPTLSDNRFIVEQTIPYVLFNLNVSKEIGDFLTASFFVNNVFNSHPLTRYKGSGALYDLAQSRPLFFGMELKINIK